MSAPSPALVGMLAGVLYELRPSLYDTARHPVDPAARRDAERLLAALDEQGMTVAEHNARAKVRPHTLRCVTARTTIRRARKAAPWLEKPSSP
ncbi:hypothetical protein ACGF4C_30440 [Streptomyces sp. NPDC048197]|uniref:hypothetical protein n=1 Tax=Streptomyces sp. NPDC048197 TaxID=3365511 RepID=UPI0037136841